MSKPKIAIVGDFLVKFGGAQQVLLSLSEIYPEAPIYCLLYDEEGTKGKFKGKHIIQSRLPKFFKKRVKFLLPYLPKTIESFDLSGFDIVISSSDSYAHGAITKPSTFHICYCHTPMRYVWDWYHEYLKENHIGFGPAGLFIRNTLHKIRIWDKVAADRVDQYVANSVNIQERIQKYYGLPSAVIYPPIDTDKIQPNGKTPEDYYLIVSRLEPYKKIDLAIQAFNKNGKRLIIVGEGTQRKYLQSIANKNIEFLGFASQEKFVETLQNTKAFIFPGEDDFGITTVEAMSAGRPVIAFGKGGTKESIIEGQTGFFFDEPTPESLENAITKLEENYAALTVENCRNRAESFSVSVFKDKMKTAVEDGYKKHLEQFGIKE